MKVHSDRVHVAPRMGKLGPKIMLESPTEEATHKIIMIVLPGFEPEPRVRRLPNMEVFSRAAIGHCGLCAVCRHPIEFTTLGVPFAISKEILELEYAHVWADKLAQDTTDAPVTDETANC